MKNSLLPANATTLEQALEESIERATELDLPIRNLWNARNCPAELLPWLAWALSIDEWDSEWPENVKRQVLESSANTHRKKGTLGAVRDALESLDATIELKDTDTPHRLDLVAYAHTNLDPNGETLLTPKLQDQMWRLVNHAKNVRTHFDFSLGVKLESSAYAVAATSIPQVIQRTTMRCS